VAEEINLGDSARREGDTTEMSESSNVTNAKVKEE